jgi:hypothetical protein
MPSASGKRLDDMLGSYRCSSLTKREFLSKVYVQLHIISQHDDRTWSGTSHWALAASIRVCLAGHERVSPQDGSS